MPNLLQLQELRSKYERDSSIRKKEIKILSEHYNKRIVEIKAFLNIQGGNDTIVDYFEGQKIANVVMLFIDITNFSDKCNRFTYQGLSSYLDSFYEIVLPIIYRHGGEVEKIMGDGIISIFGQPFLNDSKQNLFEKADQCAKDIIINLKGSDKEVKIALHDGNIMYYKNKSESYPEYTAVGKTLTELFRLESVSINNSINYYHVCEYDNMPITTPGVYSCSSKNIYSFWNKSDLIPISLQNVEWSFLKKFECTFRTG